MFLLFEYDFFLKIIYIRQDIRTQNVTWIKRLHNKTQIGRTPKKKKRMTRPMQNKIRYLNTF